MGDIALVKQTQETYSQTVMGVTKSQVTGTDKNGSFGESAYDNVTLTVNGESAVSDGNGGLVATLPNVGTVTVNAEKLLWYKSVQITSDLAEGYGITNVRADAFKENAVAGVPTIETAQLDNGYAFTATQKFRTESTIANDKLWADETGLAPIEMRISVTVSPLKKLTLTGDMASYIKLECGSHTDNADGVLYLAEEYPSLVTVTDTAGGTITAVKLNNSELENVATDAGVFQYEITLTADAELEVVGLGAETQIAFERTEGVKATSKVDGTEYTQASEQITTNERKTLVVELTAETGYTAKLEKIVAAAEEGEDPTITEITAEKDGTYRVFVDGEFTLRVSTAATQYSVQYRLNKGELASGEENPTTVTYFDTVTLKVPTREGYTFLGWKIEGSDGYITELKEVASDLTVIAEWERVAAAEPENPGTTDTPEDPGTVPEDPGDPEDPAPGNGENEGGCGAVSFGTGIVALSLLGIAGTVVFAARRKKDK